MKTNHTPGPWLIKHLANSRRDTVRIVEKINHHSVAEVRDAGFEDQGYADARLIAAAPELLAALIELCADKYLSDPINADRMQNARKAIRKATVKHEN